MNAFEKKIIQFEAEQNEAMDEYFNARPQLFRTREKELLFEAGFRMANRSQPVVELPDRKFVVDGLRVKAYREDEIIEMLQSAGIQYRIKGE